jgi:VIT1/CCC1 family predicted Fe2+/Mn2+ transporter
LVTLQVISSLLWSLLLWAIGKSMFWYWGGRLANQAAERMLSRIYPTKPAPSAKGQTNGRAIFYGAYLYLILVLMVMAVPVGQSAKAKSLEVAFIVSFVILGGIGILAGRLAARRH